MLSPILCRYSDGQLKVFDGNHRLCAYLIARPNQPVPVTVFKGPNHEDFLEVVANAHDEFTQNKYQYTHKALKYSAISEDELTNAQRRFGAEASESLAWEGISRSEAKLRIIGRVTSQLDELGHYRENWRNHGLTDQSWNVFVEAFINSLPADAPFQSEGYLRDAEIKNMDKLCQIFEEELFGYMENDTHLQHSVKTKWWKQCIKRFNKGLEFVIVHAMSLPSTPPGCAYSPEWTETVLNSIRNGVINWRLSPVWRGPTAANNEREVDNQLDSAQFKEMVLFRNPTSR